MHGHECGCPRVTFICILIMLTSVSWRELGYVVAASDAFVHTSSTKNIGWEEWEEENVCRSVSVTETILFME